MVRLLTEAVKELLAAVGAEKEECGGCCIGIPCFGENRKRDEVISEELSGELEEIPLCLVNDNIVGWAGSRTARQVFIWWQERDQLQLDVTLKETLHAAADGAKPLEMKVPAIG